MLLKLGKFQAEVADRQAIGDCISLYARGVDRADAELLTEVFWEDAKIRGELFSGGPAQFVAFSVSAGAKNWDRMMHILSNTIIRINGDRAAAESYFYGYHVGHAGSPFDLIISGRYLDRFDKRGDEWRISEKTIIFEWQREFPGSGGGKPGPMGSKVGLKGEPAPHDPSYSLFRSID
jgi:SnoaL-like domain